MMESASLTERIDKCERILKENSQSQIFAALADAYRSKGDLDQAFRICRQGLRVHPNYGPGHLVMARISYERKMFDWAEQELDQAVAMDGETRATQNLRVEILIAKGSFEDAEIAIKKLRATGVNPLMIKDLQQRLERQRKEARRRRQDQPFGNGQAPQSEAGSTSPQAMPAVKKAEPLTMSQALDRLAEMSGVRCVLCANHDGTMVDSRGVCDRDCSEVAAFGVEMRRNAEGDAAMLCLGDPRQIWVETEDKLILIIKLVQYGLILICDKETNPGSMRLVLDETIDRLQDS